MNIPTIRTLQPWLLALATTAQSGCGSIAGEPLQCADLGTCEVAAPDAAPPAPSPILVRFVPSAVPDERADHITFSAGAVPTHAPSGDTTQVGVPGCPDVYKFVHRLNREDGPLEFRIAVTGPGELAADNIRFAIRDRFEDRLLAQDLPVVERGRRGDDLVVGAVVTDEDVPALAEAEAELDIEATVTGQDGHTVATATACFRHHPLAPPLQVGLPRPATGPDRHSLYLLDLGTIAPLFPALLNAETFASLVEVPVQNGTRYPVVIHAAPISASAHYTRSWRQSLARVGVDTGTTIQCPAGTTAPRCVRTFPVVADGERGRTQIAPLGNGVALWGPGGEIQRCVECGDNAWIVPGAVPGQAVEPYTVVLNQTGGFDALRPDRDNQGPATTVYLSYLPTPFPNPVAGVFLTGALSSTAYRRCSQTTAPVLGNFVCNKVETYRAYVALDQVSVRALGPVGLSLSTSPAAGVPPRLSPRLGTRTVDDFAWVTTDLRATGALPAPLP